MPHRSVLLQEVIEGFAFQDGDVYLDATLGTGGHMEEIARRFKSRVELAGIDVDPVSVDLVREKFDLAGIKVKLAALNFRNIDKVPELLEIKRPSKILFDLGWSSYQMEESKRGFSFSRDEPLIMTLGGDKEGVTAYNVANKWQESNLADIIYGYGEERYARRIAKAIIERRARKPIETSKELAEIVKSAVPIFYRFGRIHPATRTFQAIRIAVNDELRALEEGLEKGFGILKTRGRMAVISFHSLEDRIVKRFFKREAENGKAELIAKKPIIPSKGEIEENPRSRSAKLRILKKLSDK